MGCRNSDGGTGDRNVYLFLLLFGHVCGIFLCSDQIVHYALFGCVSCLAFLLCMLVQRHTKSLCWTLALFSKKAIFSISCPLGYSFYSQKDFIFIQRVLDGFVKLLTDNQFFKVIIWAMTSQTVNYKVWPFGSLFDTAAINYSF